MAEDKDLQELQVLEQNLSNLSVQKQTLQIQLSEIESALKELETKDKAYKIVGNILIETDKVTLVEDLKNKKEVTELRLKSIDKQETKLKDKAKELQQSVMEKMK